MYKTINATDIRRKAGLTIYPLGKRCYININDSERLEMVYSYMKTKPGGVVWYFICPLTKKRCRKLYLVNGRYIHSSKIKRFYRIMKPMWFTERPINKILVLKQKQINAEKLIDQKYFKKHYAGKPTKRYLKCLKQIELGDYHSMFSIINGASDNLHMI